jgi:hypothetical protein
MGGRMVRIPSPGRIRLNSRQASGKLIGIVCKRKFLKTLLISEPGACCWHVPSIGSLLFPPFPSQGEGMQTSSAMGSTDRINAQQIACPGKFSERGLGESLFKNPP